MNVKWNHKASRLLLIFLLGKLGAVAQVQHSGWLGSFNNFRLSKDFSFYLDAQFRSTDRLDHFQQILIRPGLNYHLNKKLTLSAGYAYIPNRRIISNISGYLPEHRIWEQAMFTHKWNPVLVTHRVRFEERFLPTGKVEGEELETTGHNRAYRFRYFIRNVLPLTQRGPFNKGFFTALQDEVFLNTGDKSNVNGKVFDQNRLYGAVGYRFPFKIDLEAGYMNQYINTSTSFTNNHIVQVAVYKRL